METFTQANGLGSDLVGAMARDANGDLWVATLAGLSRLHRRQRSTNYTTADGLSSNVITALLPRTDGTLLIGTQDHGWDVWDGTNSPPRRTTDSTRRHPRHSRRCVRASVVCDRQRHRALRLHACRTADCSHWIEFGAADGLRSRETATNSHPSAWRSRDGRLWFATPKGLVEVDPAHFPVNAVPPPVALERFAVDDVDQPLHGADASDESCGGTCALRVRLRGAELCRAAEGALPLHAGGLRPATGPMPARGAPRTTPTFRRGATRSACRPPTTTAYGTRGRGADV